MDRQSTQLRDGRHVHLVRGTKTQTVNVCTPTNRAGDYERVYRLPIAEELELGDIAELADAAVLHEWCTSRNGVEERRDGRSGQPVLAPLDVDVDAAWLSAATTAVETVLDEMASQFLEHPYLHRVEHSLHAELYRRLKLQDVLRGECRLRTGQCTQSVHKEWPETIADLSPGASGRRGAFDIAVLPPQAIAAADLEHFRQGRIVPPIVLEVGLDYGLHHVVEDGKKLLNSKIRHPYLLHFSRVRVADRTAVEAYVQAPPSPVRVAYVHHDPGAGTQYKRVHDSRIHTL